MCTVSLVQLLVHRCRGSLELTPCSRPHASEVADVRDCCFDIHQLSPESAEDAWVRFTEFRSQLLEVWTLMEDRRDDQEHQDRREHMFQEQRTWRLLETIYQYRKSGHAGEGDAMQADAGVAAGGSEKESTCRKYVGLFCSRAPSGLLACAHHVLSLQLRRCHH